MSEADAFLGEPLDVPQRLRGVRGAFGTIRELARRPTGLVGLVLLSALVIGGLFSSVLAPADPTSQDILNRLASPSGDHLLGTDQLGRDLLTRVMYGARISLMVAVLAVSIAVVLGVTLGVIGGYLGGVVDIVVVTVADAVQAFPALILGLALLAAVGPSIRNLVVVIGFAFTPHYVRMSRALVLNAKHRPFIVAEQALGARPLYLARRHLLPNIFPPLLVLIAVDLSHAIIIEAGLSFLGLGVQPPDPSDRKSVV